MRATSIILPAVLAVLVVGCVDYDERIELNTDGSGLVRMHLTVSEQVLRTSTPGKIEKEADLLPIPQKDLTRDIEKEGFRVTSLRASSSRGHRHFYLVLEFDRLETLTKSQLFGNRQASLKRDGPRWEFRQEIIVSEETLTNRAGPAGAPEPDAAAPENKPEKKPDENESILKQLEKRFGKARVRQMLSGYQISFSLRLNGAGLIRTNGRSHRDTTAVWEIPLDQLIEKKPTLRMEAAFAVVEPPQADK
ncbi:MAG TPA: hypothetical protein VMZ92_06985 [Planctomycetota bacterium]|nr:hypothetical protein [Planctomycetota bacterium]